MAFRIPAADIPLHDAGDLGQVQGARSHEVIACESLAGRPDRRRPDRQRMAWQHGLEGDAPDVPELKEDVVAAGVDGGRDLAPAGDLGIGKDVRRRRVALGLGGDLRGLADDQARRSALGRIGGALLLQEKWVLMIVHRLLGGSISFRELMERGGVLTKTIQSTMPPRTRYALTEAGLALKPVLDAITEWSMTHLRSPVGARFIASPLPPASPLPLTSSFPAPCHVLPTFSVKNVGS